MDGDSVTGRRGTGHGGGLRRLLLGALSVGLLLAAYDASARLLARPDLLPGLPALAAATASLVTGQVPMDPEAMAHAGHHHHETPAAATETSDHVRRLVEEGSTLQGALLRSLARVLFGLGVGLILGVALGFAMGWSRALDDVLHPLYVVLRSVPPLALITYVMLWLGHGEAHLLLPVVYAVATTVVIPAYHGVRDVAAVYVRAARALGARGTLLLGRVVLPAATPRLLSGVRLGLLVAWMTTVGAEMLMADDGLGHLIVGGGLWSSRLEVAADPAVVIVTIVTLTAAGFVMDVVARAVGTRLTAWTQASAS